MLSVGLPRKAVRSCVGRAGQSGQEVRFVVDIEPQMKAEETANVSARGRGAPTAVWVGRWEVTASDLGTVECGRCHYPRQLVALPTTGWGKNPRTPVCPADPAMLIMPNGTVCTFPNLIMPGSYVDRVNGWNCGSRLAVIVV